MGMAPFNHYVTRICACGCGQTFAAKVNSLQRFIVNHHQKMPRKTLPVTLTGRLRRELIEKANFRCENCGITQEEHKRLHSRDLQIHHLNRDHYDNTAGNHRVLCARCHVLEDVAVRDEVRKAATLSDRYTSGELRHWATGKTKKTHPGLASAAKTKRGRRRSTKKTRSK